MSKIDEKHLLKMAAAGDTAAFEQLVLTYQTQVYNLALRMTGNPEDAADMTQEAFLRAWRALDKFQNDAAFSTWLYRLTSNACIDFLRNAKRRQTVPLTVTADEEYTLDLPDPGKTPEETLISKEEQAMLSQALALLEPEQRQLLTLRVINELSYTQIAEVLGIREGTVKSRLARARENLRKKLLQIGNKPNTAASKQQKGGRWFEL